jgi:hypothetical protein
MALTITSIIDQTLILLTLITSIVIAVYILNKLVQLVTKINFLPTLEKFMKENALVLAFIISLVATLGSLFYSEVLGYSPCKLCWFQRILMYPLPLLFGASLLQKKKIKDTLAFAMIMTTLGTILAGYHYLKISRMRRRWILAIVLGLFLTQLRIHHNSNDGAHSIRSNLNS